jgi:hypothetical protein
MIAEPAKIFKVGSNDVWRITSSPVRGWSTSLKFKAILLLVLGMVVLGFNKVVLAGQDS